MELRLKNDVLKRESAALKENYTSMERWKNFEINDLKDRYSVLASKLAAKESELELSSNFCHEDVPISKLVGAFTNILQPNELKDAKPDTFWDIAIKRIQEDHKKAEKLNEPPADPSNSSLPPSKSFKKKKGKSLKPDSGNKRKRGAQLDNPGYHRSYFTDSEADEIITVLDVNKDLHCSHRCQDTPLELYPKSDHRYYQFDLNLESGCYKIVKRISIAKAYKCPVCGKIHYPRITEGVKTTGLIGPVLASVLCYLKVVVHSSLKGLQTLVKDFFGIDVSKGQIDKTIKKIGSIFEEPVKEMAEALKEQNFVHVDETGWPEYSLKGWVWVFVAASFVVFQIGDRSSSMLSRTLGDDFKGIIISDFFSVYRKFIKNGITAQFCNEHLKRELKRLADNLDPEISSYGKKLLDDLYNIFHWWHLFKSTDDPACLVAALNIYNIFLEDTKNPPNNNKCRAIADRFQNYFKEYITFLFSTDIEATNNKAEISIRPIVIDRYITQGSRSQAGLKFCELTWSIQRTCSMNGISFYKYLREAVKSYFSGKPIPSLLGLISQGGG
jgi:hypothetical protein